MPREKDRLDLQEKADAHETEEGKNMRVKRQGIGNGVSTLM